jgi:hypothetical protein
VFWIIKYSRFLTYPFKQQTALWLTEVKNTRINEKIILAQCTKFELCWAAKKKKKLMSHFACLNKIGNI